MQRIFLLTVLLMGVFTFDVTSFRNFLSDHALCNNEYVKELTSLTKAVDCEAFMTKEVIPYPLAVSYAGSEYKRLAENIISAVNSGVLKIGVLGGSVSSAWPTPLKDLGTQMFKSIGANFNGTRGAPGTLVKVMNGAIGGTGALVPAGCTGHLLGTEDFDVIIVEFALNDRSLHTLRTLIKVVLRRYLHAAVVLLEVTSVKHKTIDKRSDGWVSGGIVAKEFGLPLVNWSYAIDQGYSANWDPVSIWPKHDPQHPGVLGQYWIALSVLQTFEAVYRHRVADSTITSGSDSNHSTGSGNRVYLPSRSEGHSGSHTERRADSRSAPRMDDLLCVSEFCMQAAPRDLASALQTTNTTFVAHAPIGAGTDTGSGQCWKKFNHRHKNRGTCERYVQFLNGTECSDPSAGNTVLSLSFTVSEPCHLHIAMVGKAHTGEVHCNLDVVDSLAGSSSTTLLKRLRVKMTNFIMQSVADVAEISAGAHVVSLVPKLTWGTTPGPFEEACSVSSVICIPTWAMSSGSHEDHL